MRNAVSIRITLVLCWLGAAGAPSLPQQQSDPKDQPSSKSVGDLSLEELMEVHVDTVYGAAKFEQKITEAPSSVTIVSADQIRKYGYRTFADILRSVPGFYVNYDRNYSYVGVRGFGRPGDYNTRVLILVDGHGMNDDVYGGTYIGTDFPIDIDLIERIEIIRGPGSALYGTSALLAVINVVTKRGHDFGGLEVSASGGGLQSYQGRVTFGRRLNSGLDLLLSSTGYDSKGYRRLFFPEFDSPANNNGIAQDADTDKFHNSFASADYRDFTIHAAYSSREKRIPTASFGTVFDDRRTLTTDTRFYVDLQYQHSFESALELTARAFYDRYKYDAVYAEPPVDPGQSVILNQDFARGEWLGFELDVSKRLRKKHRVTVGTEQRFNLEEVQGNYNLQPYALFVFDSRSSSVPAVYAQDEFTVRKNVKLFAGLRYDRYYSFGGTLNPRIALVYSPAANTAIKVLYGRAFRAPSEYELYYYQSAISRLQPETIQTIELAFERYLSRNTWMRASGFYNEISHLIGQTTDPLSGNIEFVNLAGARVKGLTAELNEKGLSGWEGRISYTIQDARDALSGGVLSNSPKQLAKLNVIAPLAKNRFFGSFEGQYTSRRRTVAGTDIGGFFIANLTLYSEEFAKRLQVSASVYNLFGKRYADPGAEEHLEPAITQDGRNFRIKLVYRF